MALQIEHEPGRFIVRIDAVEAFVVYERRDDVCDIVHTFTPPALRGRDIAAALTRAAVELAHAEGLRIQATCSYTQRWLAQHPEHRR